MITDKILEKANKILIKKRLEQRKQYHKAKRDARIVEAGLCPCCGETLTYFNNDSLIEQYLKQNKLYAGYDYYDELKFCTKDRNHFEIIKGYNIDDIE